MLNFFMNLGIVVFILICLFLILVVLIQKGRGGGLASAFGGSGGNTAFGAKTGDVLTWVTSVVFGVFLLLAIALNLMADAHNRAIAWPAPPVESEIPPLSDPISPPAVPTPPSPGTPAEPINEPGTQQAPTDPGVTP